MNTSPTRVLLVDDERNEYLLISKLLRSVPRGNLQLNWASNFDSALEMMTRNEHDVCLLDYRLGSLDGVTLIHKARAGGCSAPMILLTGAAGYEVDVPAMQAGAVDFLEKEQLTPALLERVIRHALERKRVEEALRTSEERYRLISTITSDLAYCYRLEPGWKFICEWVTEAFTRITGFTLREMDAEGRKRMIHPEDLHLIVARFDAFGEGRPDVREFRIITKNGETKWMRAYGRPVIDSKHGFIRVFAAARDITDEKLADQALQLSEKRLRESRESLRALSVRQQNAIEKERRRIAREIHDELGHQLSVTRINLAWITKRLAQLPGEVQPLLQKVEATSRLIEATVQSARRLTTDLRPGVLDTLGLPAAIEWEANHFEEQTAIHCLVKLPANPVRLDDDTATALFRILQESLTNVARHARASKVKIQLKRDTRHVRLEIHDNGKGIKPSEIANSRSFGLLGMRERAGALGGEIHFESARGTKVTVRIPILSPSVIAEGAESRTVVENRNPEQIVATP